MSSLVHYIGGCHDCGKQWSTRNVLGVAARHSQATGHTTWVETGHAYEFGPTAWDTEDKPIRAAFAKQCEKELK